MYCNRKFQMIICLSILAAMIFFPVRMFAQENKESVEHEAGFYYTVQKGDTLWDLSDQFFDSSWLWPDLWSENNQISNPHWIYPGERIRIFHQKGAERFVGKTVAKPRALKIEPQKELFYYYSPIDKIGFIRKDPVIPSGVIFKAKDDKELISAGDLVFIRTKGDRHLLAGSKYSVYRTTPIIDQKTEALIGTQHYLTGVVEITKIDPRFAVARVVQSYRTIEVGNLLMPYKRRSPRIELTQSKKGLNGELTISEENADIIGDNDIAFIDKGSKDDVKPGQQYSIYYQEVQRLNTETKEDVLLTRVVYGTLLVLHTEQTTSTVLITRSDQSINPGAKICSPIE
ncbi:hypothetical protein C6A36_00255 [Desulfobacteraceae bacterium SEEP-SAG10]|nr:hypothetical protein C6A36_00255 [Desulfobacteraceae bacterium SEEP-SAG10]